MTFTDPLFSHRFLALKAAATVYVVAIPISHFALPHSMVWEIALFFLIAMLFTYPAAALIEKQDVQLEFSVSVGLAALGVVGFFVSPWLIILALFGHGIWDLAKHHGHGVPFFGWYISGCVAVDWAYSAALTIYLVSGAAL